MTYDFKSARQRIMQLGNYYRRLSKMQPDDGTWSWWLMAEIEELEREIEVEHKKEAAANSCNNVLIPSVPAWEAQSKNG